MRLAVVVIDEADLAAKLEQAAKAIDSDPSKSFSTPTGIHFGIGESLGEGGLAYLFSGQGSQYLHMGASVAMQFASALEPWDRAANFEWDGTTRLHDVVFPNTAFDDESKAEQERDLAATEWAQPAIAFALGFRMHWLGKAAIFRPPFGRLMRWLGGIPVIRSRSTNLVTSIVESLADRDEVYVIIPPEGTRSKSGHWKSGFYWVVVEAGIPIILGYLDYARREGGLGETFVPSGDLEADLEKIREFYSGVEGKYPDLQGEITLEDVDR